MTTPRFLFFAFVSPLLVFAVIVAALHVNVIFRESREPRQTAPGEGKFIRLGTAELFVQEKGTRNLALPSLVFLHGAGTWSQVWKPTMEAVANLGFHALAIDLPPFGFSTVKDHSYDPVSQSNLILGVLDQLQLSDAVLVGHSFGTSATLTAANRLAKRLRGLILVDIGIGLPSEEDADLEPPSEMAQWIASRRFACETVAALATYPGLTSPFFKLALYNEDAATPRQILFLQQPNYNRGRSKQIADWLPTFLGEPDEGLFRATFYQDIKVPTLVIWGEEDEITPVWQGRKMAKLIKGAQLKVLPESGHFPYLESPALFQASLSEFLKANFPAPPQRANTSLKVD